MTKLVWGQPDQLHYEAGVDRGVLYSSSGNGVVWNGITSIDEAFDGGEVNSFYYDGTKYLDTVSPKNYQATLTAFSAPEEFSSCIGEKSVIPGFILTRQPRDRFGLSYRTLIDGDRGYKLHLVYNASAIPSTKSYTTLSDSVEANTLSWQINAVPMVRDTYRPSAHFVLDSTKIPVDVLQNVETMLYGSLTENGRLPSVDELLDIVAIWSPLIIIPQSISGLAQLVSGVGDLYRTTVVGILRALPNTSLYKSPIDGVYRKG
jgi:hypothetical protein